MSFFFSGVLSSSKSLMNRALILKSFFPELRIHGNSSCDDVVLMEKALNDLVFSKASKFDVGYGGTTFRFLAARLSRARGKFFIQMPQRLRHRPHEGLLQALNHFGVQWQQDPKGLRLDCRGWTVPSEAVTVSAEPSSQFVSAVLLSSWLLEKELILKIDSAMASKSYFEMTLSFLKKMGLSFEDSTCTEKVEGFEGTRTFRILRVSSGQRLLLDEYHCEPDMSSCFAIAAFAALLGRCEIRKFPSISLQPDVAFVDILKTMGVSVIHESDQLLVSQASSLKAIHRNLEETPDLFPVLSVLLSQANGISRLSGLKTLAHKESNRLKKTQELLMLMGVRSDLEGDVFVIHGSSKSPSVGASKTPLLFDPDQDHRMVMAASLAHKLGYPLAVLEPHHVSKSFPEFFDCVGIDL